MVLSQQDTRIVEKRVFVVVMVFSIVSGLFAVFSSYLSFFLRQLFGLSIIELGFVGILLSVLQYLLSPVLFFVVLYVTCGGPLLIRVASVLVSLVFGSLVGYSIGSLIGSVVVAVHLGQPAVVYSVLLFVPQHVVAQTLMGFSVLAFSDISIRWRNALPVEELQRRRPGGITVLAALYMVLALLNTVAVPFSSLYASIFGSMHGENVALLIITLCVVSGLVAAGQLVVAGGLYHGKKWGWIIAVISSASILVIDVLALGVMIVLGGFASSPLLLLVSFGGVVIGLTVLFYLLSVEVRKFFGFINPPAQVQDKTTVTEPA